MKTRIITLLLVALCSLGVALAQHPGERPSRPKMSREELTKAKRVHLTKVLELTPAEADQLAKELDDLDSQRYALWKELSPLHRRVAKGDKTLTPQELETLLEHRLTARVKEAELERTFYLRCKSFLSIDKLLRLEQEHRHFVSKYFREQRGREGKK